MTTRFTLTLLITLHWHIGWATSAEAVVGHFSSMTVGGNFTDDWEIIELPSLSPTNFELVTVDDATVVRAEARASAASLVRTLPTNTTTGTHLTWRWRINRRR